jgi:hypothetical protein
MEVITPGLKPKLNVETEVSAYDKFNATLQVLLWMFGMAVGLMLMIWLTSHFKWQTPIAAVEISEEMLEGEEGEKAPEGVAEDFFEPGVEEFPDVETPQLMDALEAVTNAVSSVRANNSFMDGDAAEMGKGRGLGNKRGGGGGGNGVIPEAKRWRIEHTASDLDTYAKQLSAFKIDVGSIVKDNNDVYRLRDPGGARQVINSTRASEEKVLYFGHQKPKLRQWDERLLRKSNIPYEKSLVVQFYPDSTREILRGLEKQRMEQNQKNLKQIKNTIFKLQTGGKGPEFIVVDQIYR